MTEEFGVLSGKELYVSQGYDHTSFDWNGKRGSIAVDLTKLNENYNETFEIVTDHGTIEHIPEQYNVFKNLHNWGKEDDVHIVPLHSMEHLGLVNRRFPPHGFYEYSTKFWVELCKACNYKLIDATNQVRNMESGNKLNHYSSCVYVKTKDSSFVEKTEFDELHKKLTLFYKNGSNV